VLVDVGRVFDRKEAALRCYVTALESVDYVRTATGLAAYRSASGGMGGRGYAEGFVRLSATEHAELVHRAGLLEAP
jgi:N-acetylglucosamine malate deacetylase 1